MHVCCSFIIYSEKCNFSHKSLKPFYAFRKKTVSINYFMNNAWDVGGLWKKNEFEKIYCTVEVLLHNWYNIVQFVSMKDKNKIHQSIPIFAENLYGKFHFFSTNKCVKLKTKMESTRDFCACTKSLWWFLLFKSVNVRRFLVCILFQFDSHVNLNVKLVRNENVQAF